MSWIKNPFAPRKTYYEEFASNLYDALVLGGGPSSEAASHIDAAELEIPLDQLHRFASKRLIMLEAFLFVATNVATLPENGEECPFRPVHPLAVEMGKVLRSKWAQRGIFVSDHSAVGDRCFAEIENALEKPFPWGRAWLDEFYSDPEKSGEHYILWTEQCLKEIETMKQVVAQQT